MGNCFSDPSSDAKAKKSTGHTLGSAPAPAASTPAAAPSAQRTPSQPGRPVGDGFEDVNRSKDPREMARAAAEQRAAAVSVTSTYKDVLTSQADKKGVHASNPKSGQLAAKLAAERRSSNTNKDERMMVSLDDGCERTLIG
jgi:hypothetical protein